MILTAKKQLIFLLLIVSFDALDSVAQVNDTSRVWRHGVYFSFPVQIVNLDDLNQDLAQRGLAELVPSMVGFTIGFSSRHREQNSYGLTKLSYLTTFDDEDDESEHVRINLWKMSFQGHYDVLPNKNWLAYPYLGLGLGLAFLNVTELNIPQSPLLGFPSDSYSLWKYYSDILVNGSFGVGLERKFLLPGSTGYIGISGGYELSSQSDWKLRDTNYSPSTSPTFRTSGWIFELKLRFELDLSTLTEKEKQPRGLFKFFQ